MQTSKIIFKVVALVEENYELIEEFEYFKELKVDSD